MLPLLLGWALLPGFCALSGPVAVWGWPGGSVSVECGYEEGFETAPKFWCKPGLLFTCYARHYLVATAPRQPRAHRGRFAVADERSRRAFRVTMGNLSRDDAGPHLCGIRLPWRDLSHAVEVIVAGLPNATEPPPSPSPRPGDPGPPRRPDASPGSPLLCGLLLLLAAKGLVLLGLASAGIRSGAWHRGGTGQAAPGRAELLPAGLASEAWASASQRWG
ncbi:CMRF35-like molecule 6 [Dromaius novaehollandiae]|uniref:CMRF35-like molecule 6 n=1 Tax=Dromaius novaehollandiae TaxID=8790 RepID=UPI00311E3A00